MFCEGFSLCPVRFFVCVSSASDPRSARVGSLRSQERARGWAKRAHLHLFFFTPTNENLPNVNMKWEREREKGREQRFAALRSKHRDAAVHREELDAAVPEKPPQKETQGVPAA